MTRRSFHWRRRGESLTGLLMIRAPRTVSRTFSGRSAILTIGLNLRINMNSYSSGRRPHRSRGGGRRRGNNERFRERQGTAKTQKKTFWQRVAEFFGNGGEKKKKKRRPGKGGEASPSGRETLRRKRDFPPLFA